MNTFEQSEAINVTNEDKRVARYSSASARLNKAFAELKAVTDEAEAFGFVSDGLVHEAAVEYPLCAEALAAILMQYFDWENRAGLGHKRFLLELSEALGPDHMENMRKSVSFMQKVVSY